MCVCMCVCVYICVCMYVQGNAFKIQIPSHCNLIRRSMSAPPPMLSPSSILPPLVSCHTFFLEMKNPARLSKMFFDFFFSFFKTAYLKLYKLRSACTETEFLPDREYSLLTLKGRTG